MTLISIDLTDEEMYLLVSALNESSNKIRTTNQSPSAIIMKAREDRAVAISNIAWKLGLAKGAERSEAQKDNVHHTEDGYLGEEQF